jgi:ABC-type amino acid transport substrate-binding protein
LAIARGSSIRGAAGLRAGDVLAVVRGSAADEWARRELRDRGVGLRRVAVAGRALRLLRRHRVDAALVGPPAGPARVGGDRGGIRIASRDVDVGDYRVFAVSRDDPALLAAIDGELAELIRSGWYRHEQRRWFGETKIPPEVGST